MAQRRRPVVHARDLQGFQYFRLLIPFLQRLQDVGTARDRAGNRQLFFDQYLSLLLLYFVNPVLTSLRGLQQASGLDKVQKLLGVRRTSLGSFSEASGVFAAAPLRQIVQELARQALPLQHGREAEALRGQTAIDGTLLAALPRMAWALWQDDRHRAANMQSAASRTTPPSPWPRNGRCRPRPKRPGWSATSSSPSWAPPTIRTCSSSPSAW